MIDTEAVHSNQYVTLHYVGLSSFASRSNLKILNHLKKLVRLS